MKKNWVLRLGLLAMVLTLVTMPMVSSTYAKYVTSATGSDTARAAKWGVTVNADFQNVFGDAYEATATDTSVAYTDNTATVIAEADNTDVIAPGTKGSFTFGISGDPEVSVATDYTATITRTNWTVDGDDYDPIKYTITRTIDGVTSYYDTSAGTWSAVSGELEVIGEADLEALINAIANTYVPNSDFSESYTVNWEWLFFNNANFLTNATGTDVQAYYVSNGLGGYVLSTEANSQSATFVPGLVYYSRAGGAEPYTYTKVDTSLFLPSGNLTYDQADTYLGNLAFGGTLPTISIQVVATATQIN